MYKEYFTAFLNNVTGFQDYGFKNIFISTIH